MSASASPISVDLNERRRRVPMYFQSETTECSIACLAMIASHFGKQLSIADIRSRFPASLRGLSLKQVVETAADCGLTARPVRCEPSDLVGLECPIMLHWDLQHFVVLVKASKDRLTVHDPARGIRDVGISEAGRHFSGIAVLFKPAPEQNFSGTGRRLTLRGLIGRTAEIRPLVARTLLLSAVFEMLLLAQPLLLKQAINPGFGTGDLSYVARLAALGVLASLCVALVSLWRDRALATASLEVTSAMTDKLFRHSLALPCSFYERRITSHLIDRYRSMETIERFITGEVPVAVLDGLFALLSLALMCFFSIELAGATLLMFSCYLLYRTLTLRSLNSCEEQAVYARSYEAGFLNESLQNILSIKVRSFEAARHMTWLSRVTASINAQWKVALSQARNRAARLLFVGVDLSVFLLLGTVLIRAGRLELAAALGILLYKTHFIARSTAFVDRIAGYTSLRVHLTRLEDIVFAEPERLESAPSLPVRDVDPNIIEVEGVSFAYSPFDPPILVNTSFTVARGEFVALVGPSGSGKTTLLKLLLGLYPASGGVIRVGGLTPDGEAPGLYRRQFGVVMQNDELFVGTIAENVSFFDPAVDVDRVWKSLEQAELLEDVTSFPMGIETFIGGGSGSLSGGQRQRLLIARALYGRHDILVFDEGTANLDRDRELAVIGHLRRTGATVIMIAHGHVPVSAADRVLSLRNGEIVEVDRKDVVWPATMVMDRSAFRKEHDTVGLARER